MGDGASGLRAGTRTGAAAPASKQAQIPWKWEQKQKPARSFPVAGVLLLVLAVALVVAAFLKPDLAAWAGARAAKALGRTP